MPIYYEHINPEPQTNIMASQTDDATTTTVGTATTTTATTTATLLTALPNPVLVVGDKGVGKATVVNAIIDNFSASTSTSTAAAAATTTTVINCDGIQWHAKPWNVHTKYYDAQVRWKRSM